MYAVGASAEWQAGAKSDRIIVERGAAQAYVIGNIISTKAVSNTLQVIIQTGRIGGVLTTHAQPVCLVGHRILHTIVGVLAPLCSREVHAYIPFIITHQLRTYAV